MDNLLIDRAVMLDYQRGKRNLSMVWIDVRKTNDSVDYDWLCAMTDVYRLPIWLGKVIRRLCASWYTRVVATTRQGDFHKNKVHDGTTLGGPVAWRLRATDAGYRPPPESEKVLSGTREEGSPSARRVWYEDGRDNYHHGSWGRKTLQIPGGARERSTG